MKTTVNIPDSLFEEAKLVAREEQTTIKALLEEGLRRTLDEHKKSHPFRLRDASVDGDGLQPHLANGSWERIRDMIYEGHGA
ncbi:MAG TPA: DUF2191 domain-containing protein [Candidatus Hydrogenedentes bacterium]|nr:DUF2191 domain-containing protein [Candidatus Hydrogenedentota bacterium]